MGLLWKIYSSAGVVGRKRERDFSKRINKAWLHVLKAEPEYSIEPLVAIEEIAGSYFDMPNGIAGCQDLLIPSRTAQQKQLWIHPLTQISLSRYQHLRAQLLLQFYFGRIASSPMQTFTVELENEFYWRTVSEWFCALLGRASGYSIALLTGGMGNLSVLSSGLQGGEEKKLHKNFG